MTDATPAPTDADSAGIHADRVIDEARVRALPLLVALLCGLVLAVDGFDTQAIGFVAPQLTRLWHIPPAQLGYLFSSALVGLMIGYLLISPLAGRFGPKRVCIACVAGFGLLSMLTITARGPYELMLYRLITGIGLGGALPPAVALCGEFAPRRLRSSFITFMYCGLSLGQIAAGFATIWLLAAHGWQAVLLLGGVLPLLLAVVLWKWLPESIEFQIRQRHPQPRLRAVLERIAPGFDPTGRAPITASDGARAGASVGMLFAGRRGFGTLMFWTALFMNLAVLFFVQNWLPTIFRDLGWSQNAAISATSLSLSGGLLAAVTMGPLMDRFGAYRVLAGLFVAGGLFVGGIGGAQAGAHGLMLGIGFCMGFCVSGIQKCANALAVFFYPVSLRATGLGWGLGIGRAGAIIGPALAGNLFAFGWGVPVVFAWFTLPMFVGAAAILAMGLRYRGGSAAASTASSASVKVAT